MKSIEQLRSEFEHEIREIVSETIIKKEVKDASGQKKMEYSTNKKGYKVMFDKNGQPIEVKMDQKEKFNRAQGAGKSSSVQKKRSKGINLDKLRQMASEADEEEEDIDDTEDEVDVDDSDTGDSEEGDSDIPDEVDPDDSIETDSDDGAEIDPETGIDDEEGFDDDTEEDSSPKSKTIYVDIEEAIDELDVYTFTNAFKMYEKILDYLYDDSSIKLVNYVYELIPPKRRKKVSADTLIKQIEDQIEEKRK
jgi:hypothetical protein